jgi:hypothetical protein
MEENINNRLKTLLDTLTIDTGAKVIKISSFFVDVLVNYATVFLNS